jgi:integrase
LDPGTTERLFACPLDSTKHVLDVRKAHDAAVRRAGIEPPLRLYDLRHTALTRMAMSGIDLPTLKELTGHSQVQMTMRYVHPTPEHKRRAIEKFEGFNSSQVLSIAAQIIGVPSPH